MNKYFLFDGGFKLESGEELASPVISYHTYGTLNKDASNVIWVCHALTANSDAAEWWKGLVGDGFLFDPARDFIVCANVLGSCYGTTGPLSKNPAGGGPYYHDFPFISIKDMVKAHIELMKHLGIEKIKLLIGGSLGGQQALEWAIEEPERIKRLILVAANAIHSPWGIAYNEAQRMAIRADKTINERLPNAGKAGLEAARAIAMLSYRTYETFQLTQEDRNKPLNETAAAVSYQQYQGQKLSKRFNAFSYITLLNAMDSHDIGRGRKSIEDALTQIQANTLVVSISSDNLFPVDEQRRLALFIPDSSHTIIHSIYGHDGFLIETGALRNEIIKFLLETTNVSI